MSEKVLVTRKLPEKAMKLLHSECYLTVNPYDRPMTRQELERAIEPVCGLLPLLTDTIDSTLIDKAPKLRVIANYAVGYNNIDLDYCSKKNIRVSNTPGVLTEATADLTWSLMMALARRVVEGDLYIRQGKFKAWSPSLLLGQDIYQKKLGIIGFGRIGAAVAKRARGFNMTVLYCNRNRLSSYTENKMGISYRSLDQLLQQADYVTLHVPLNEHTHHLIGSEELRKMKETAYLINTSRGSVIDEKALVQALQDRVIAGAALDVYENEPELTPGLAELSQTILTPHIASATVQTRTEMAMVAVKNLLAGLKGEVMPNLVNKDLLGL